MPVCKCNCHEDTIMSCMDLYCGCCRHSNQLYMHSGIVDEKKYADLVAEMAVKKYRYRNHYLGIEFDLRDMYETQNMVGVSLSHRIDGFDRFAKKK